MEFLKLKPLSVDYLQSIGFSWHTDSDESSYIADEAVLISEDEASEFIKAGNEIYDMYVEAGEHVIKNDLLHEIGIPFNLANLVRESWENEANWHLYGRFDFAGGIDGLPIKLLEFNADTPTSLFESAIIQWALLKANDMDDRGQFNFIYEALRDNFRRLITLDEDISNFHDIYQGYKMLFSSVSDNAEEINTTKFLQHIATEAGLNTDFEFIENVSFSDDGIFAHDKSYEMFFKLIPWEEIAFEDELALILDQIIKQKNALIYNPAYTLMFQSKAMLKILWDLFPNHPYLLQSSFEPLRNQKQVEKRIFGREGANVRILDLHGNPLISNDGEYANYKPIYQAYAPLAKDGQNRSYQAGVFYAYEACGLGFRRGSLIMDNMSKFVAHYVKERE